MPARRTYPEVEVRAGAMSLFIAAFDVFPSIAQRYLIARGLAKLSKDGKLIPSRTYIPLDLWLETFEAVLGDIGPNALFKIGQRIIGNPHFPVAVADLEAALRTMDVAYHLSHRKSGAPMYEPNTNKMLEGIGHYIVYREGRAKSITIECDTPYPCALEHGMVTGVTGQMEPRAVVTHLHSSKCRQKGGVLCVYLVSW